jgi:hypothetical protein
MSKKYIIVTGADAKFFELARGCIQSIRDKPEASLFAIGFFDLGCTEEQKAWLRTNVDFIREPDWEFDVPGRDELPSFHRGLMVRPFLPKHFPGYKVYLWLDADTWLQTWDAILLLVQGAELRTGMAIVPELDRGSRIQYGGLPDFYATVYHWYMTMGFDEDVATKLCTYPMLNSGVVATHHDAPHWHEWQHQLAFALQRHRPEMTDQIALNYAIYVRGLLEKTELLPAWCNWTCHYGYPYWDHARECLVEPYLPHTTVSIVHLTNNKTEIATVGTEMYAWLIGLQSDTAGE